MEVKGSGLNLATLKFKSQKASIRVSSKELGGLRESILMGKWRQRQTAIVGKGEYRRSSTHLSCPRNLANQRGKQAMHWAGVHSEVSNFKELNTFLIIKH